MIAGLGGHCLITGSFNFQYYPLTRRGNHNDRNEASQTVYLILSDLTNCHSTFRHCLIGLININIQAICTTLSGYLLRSKKADHVQKNSLQKKPIMFLVLLHLECLSVSRRHMNIFLASPGNEKDSQEPFHHLSSLSFSLSYGTSRLFCSHMLLLPSLRHLLAVTYLHFNSHLTSPTNSILQILFHTSPAPPFLQQ